MSSGFAGLNGPYCYHCRKDKAEHAADKKCIWGPTYFELTIHTRSWQDEGREAVWICPSCNGSNVITGLNPIDVFEKAVQCITCKEPVRVLG
jgi:hypothetical protein